MAERDFSCPCIIGDGSSPSRCGPSLALDTDGQSRDIPASDAILLRVMWPSPPAGPQCLSHNGIAHVAFDHEDSLRSREFIISWLTPTPHATAVYASCSASPPPHATLASRRPATALPGPDSHRLIASALLAPSCRGRDARFIARPPPRTVRAAFPHT